MQKDKDKWTFDHLSWKRQVHSLMKQSISCPGVPYTFMAIEIKWCPLWSLLYLQIFAMVLSSIATPTGQLMTPIVIVFCVGSITTTLATKRWFSWVMKRLPHNEILDVKVYYCSFYITWSFFRANAYMTFLMASCVIIREPANIQHVRCVPHTSNPCSYSHVKKLDV
jgi:hypothetical protein